MPVRDGFVQLQTCNVAVLCVKVHILGKKVDRLGVTDMSFDFLFLQVLKEGMFILREKKYTSRKTDLKYMITYF